MLLKLQDEIYDFLEDANQILPESDALYYGDTFLSGKIERPDILFLGINPGFKGWESRPRQFTRRPFQPSACKYIEEHQDGRRLARRIVDIILAGDAQRLKACAETSVSSFFGTPNAEVLNHQLSLLRPSGLADRHEAMMTKALAAILDFVSPQEIICIGVTTFDKFVKSHGIRDRDIETAPKAPGDNCRHYMRTTMDGIPVHGVYHPSGRYLSTTMSASMREIFADLWPSAASL